jgi:predicted nucleic acid-binding protein
MKGLDTPILLALLHDSKGAKELVKCLRGEEAATTEINVYELKVLAGGVAAVQRESREAALARLRRRVTVLPITADSLREAGRFLKGTTRPVGYQPLVWGTLVAAGCAEWITSRPFAPPRVGLPFKVRIM